MSMFSACKVELEFSAGTWTDVTAYAYEPITITGGRPTIYDDVAPGTLTLPLRNDDGRFTTSNTSSPYYPHFKEGTRIRFSMVKGGVAYRRFTGYISAVEMTFPAIDGGSDTVGTLTTVTALDSLSVLDNRLLYGDYTERVLYTARNLGTWADCFIIDSSLVSGADAQVVSAGTGTPGTASTIIDTGAQKLQVSGPEQFQRCYEGVMTMTSDLQGSGTGSASHWSLFEILPRSGLRTLELDMFTFAGAAPSSTSLEYALVAYNGGGGTIFTVKFGVVSGTVAFYLFDSGGTQRASWASIGGSPGVVGVMFRMNATTNTSMDVRVLGGATATVASCDVRNIAKIDIGGAQGIDIGGVFTAGSNSSSFDFGAGFMDQVGDTIAGRITSFTNAFSEFTPGFTSVGNDFGRSIYNGYWWKRTGLDAAQETMRSNGGIVWARTDGTVLFMAPDALRPLTSLLTLDLEADCIGAGMPVCKTSKDTRPTRVTVNGGIATFTYTDPDTEGLNPTPGQRKDMSIKTLNGPGGSPVMAWARMLHPPRLRFEQVTLDLLSGAHDYTATIFDTSTTAGALFPTQRFTLTVPSVIFGTTSTDVYAYGWVETYTQNSAQIQLDCEPAVIAHVTGGTCVGNTSTGTVIITSDSPFPTNATAYPMDFDWAGERITCNAPGGATSPQTFTVTARGVTGGAAASSHSSGTSIDAWIAGV